MSWFVKHVYCLTVCMYTKSIKIASAVCLVDVNFIFVCQAWCLSFELFATFEPLIISSLSLSGGSIAVQAALSFPDATLGGVVAASTFLSLGGGRRGTALWIGRSYQGFRTSSCHDQVFFECWIFLTRCIPEIMRFLFFKSTNFVSTASIQLWMSQPVWEHSYCL